MTYNIQIQSCALVVLILFAVEFFLHKRENNYSTRAFKKLIIFALFLAVDDILCPIALSMPGCPHIIRLITGKMYIILMYFCLFSILAFTISLTMKDKKRYNRKLAFYKVITYLELGAAALTIALPLSYVSEQTYVYIYGPAQSTCYIAAICIMVLVVGYMFANRKSVPMNQKMPIYTYLIIGVVTGVIEKIEPRLLLTTFGLVIDIGLILFTLQNPYIKELEEKNERINGMYEKVIKSLVSLIDAKDRYTRGHSQRVAEYSMEIARRMGKTEEEQQYIYTAGLLHDIGKIRVPEALINKPGKLTDDEFSEIKVHTVSGSRILSHIFDDKNIVLGAKYHHERYDGKGYPNGLVGEVIPEVARIIGVADSYDAMTSNRSYRKHLPQEVVRSELEKGRGTQFDPVIVDVMLEMVEQDKKYRLKETTPLIKKILVTSNLKDKECIEEVLKLKNNYQVDFEDQVDSVMAMLSKDDIQLVVVDLYSKNGKEIYEAVTYSYDIPIIVITDEKSSQVIDDTLNLSIDCYLTRPIDQVILREGIHNIINVKF